jgi:hypothetical protein
MNIPSQATISNNSYVLVFRLPFLERRLGEAWKPSNQTTLFPLPNTLNKLCLTSPVIFQFSLLFRYVFFLFLLSFFLIFVFKHLYKYKNLCGDLPFLTSIMTVLVSNLTLDTTYRYERFRGFLSHSKQVLE